MQSLMEILEKCTRCKGFYPIAVMYGKLNTQHKTYWVCHGCMSPKEMQEQANKIDGIPKEIFDRKDKK